MRCCKNHNVIFDVTCPFCTIESLTSQLAEAREALEDIGQCLTGVQSQWNKTYAVWNELQIAIDIAKQALAKMKGE